MSYGSKVLWQTPFASINLILDLFIIAQIINLNFGATSMSCTLSTVNEVCRMLGLNTGLA